MSGYNTCPDWSILYEHLETIWAPALNKSKSTEQAAIEEIELTPDCEAVLRDIFHWYASNPDGTMTHADIRRCMLDCGACEAVADPEDITDICNTFGDHWARLPEDGFVQFYAQALRDRPDRVENGLRTQSRMPLTDREQIATHRWMDLPLLLAALETAVRRLHMKLLDHGQGVLENALGLCVGQPQAIRFWKSTEEASPERHQDAEATTFLDTSRAIDDTKTKNVQPIMCRDDNGNYCTPPVAAAPAGTATTATMLVIITALALACHRAWWAWGHINYMFGRCNEVTYERGSNGYSGLVDSLGFLLEARFFSYICTMTTTRKKIRSADTTTTSTTNTMTVATATTMSTDMTDMTDMTTSILWAWGWTHSLCLPVKLFMPVWNMRSVYGRSWPSLVWVAVDCACQLLAMRAHLGLAADRGVMPRWHLPLALGLGLLAVLAWDLENVDATWCLLTQAPCA